MKWRRNGLDDRRQRERGRFGRVAQTGEDSVSAKAKAELAAVWELQNRPKDFLALAEED